MFNDVTAEVAADVVVSEAVLAANWLMNALLRVMVVVLNTDAKLVFAAAAVDAAVAAVPSDVVAVITAVDAFV